MDLHCFWKPGYFSGSQSIDRQLEEWIRSGIAGDDRYTAEEIIHGVLVGRFQVFRYPQGIVVTQITGHNRLLVFLLSGENFDAWKEKANEDLKAYAKAIGAEAVEAYCRPGLEKSLKDLGWKKTQVVLRLQQEKEALHVGKSV